MNSGSLGFWGVILGLSMMAILQLHNSQQLQSDFAIMPILAPVSLDYEQYMRDGRKPLNIGEMMKILPELEKSLDPAKVSMSELLLFQEHRNQMLELRNERHQLNIALMDDGIALLKDLTPAQWDWVQSQRDHNQAVIEMQIVESLIKDLLSRDLEQRNVDQSD